MERAPLRVPQWSGNWAAFPSTNKDADFVREIRRFTGDGVDADFDGIGGNNL